MGGIRLHSFCRNNERSNHTDVVAHANLCASNLTNVGMLAQYSLHFLRRDAIAERIHQVVGAAKMDHIAVLVERCQVAADEPFIAIYLGFFLRAIPVAEHETGIGTMHGQEPFFTRSQRFSSPFEWQDGDAATRLRFADGACLAWYARRRGHVGGDFTHAERLIEFGSRLRRPFLKQSGR